MRVHRIPVASAAGHLLAHHAHHGGKRILKKGIRIDDAAIAALRTAGIETIWTAELEPGDVGENTAADRIAAAVCGDGVTASKAATGRVTLRAETRGVVRLLLDPLFRINMIPGVTLAVVNPNTTVAAGEAIATIKIIPFALPESAVAGLEGAGARALWVDPITPRPVALVVWGSEANRDALFDGFRTAIADRLTALGQGELEADYVALGDDPEAELAGAIAERARRVELLLLAGESAIIDLDDLVPNAVRRAGGEVHWLGAPVFPGNLLLLARRGHCTIIGAPGCARSPTHNVVDLLLPRLLAGETLGASDIVGLAYGGMLSKKVT